MIPFITNIAAKILVVGDFLFLVVGTFVIGYMTASALIIFILYLRNLITFGPAFAAHCAGEDVREAMLFMPSDRERSDGR